MKWKHDTCDLCGRRSSLIKSSRGYTYHDMISNGDMRIHFACKEELVSILYQQLGIELARFTVEKFGLKIPYGADQ